MLYKSKCSPSTKVQAHGQPEKKLKVSMPPDAIADNDILTKKCTRALNIMLYKSKCSPSTKVQAHGQPEKELQL
jgi:hypothetical protein